MSPALHRRHLLGLAATSAAAATVTVLPAAQAQSLAPANAPAPGAPGTPALPEAGTALAELPARSGPAAATDSAYWEAVRRLYAVQQEPVNLENGYWGVMAEPVRQVWMAANERVNRENALYARTRYGADAEAARQQLATALGAAPEEIAFTRGATEALQLLIGGYRRLQPGDTVVYSDLDYDSMQYAMNWLQERRGVQVRTFSIPEPASRDAVLQAYRRVLADTPRARLLLLTQVSHRTGLVMPVAEIAAMAKARGVDVILDAAHGWGQLDYRVAELGVDFIGFNLHKWIGAPLGLGFLYIARDRLADIDRAMADEDFPATDIRSRVHTGTFNFATVMTLPAALALHQRIGPAAKAARLRHLRDRWVTQVRGLPGLEILTPDEPGMAAGITAFRLAGQTSAAQNNALVQRLREQHGVFTVRRAGVARGQCVRVSPALYTREADVDRLAAALRQITRG